MLQEEALFFVYGDLCLSLASFFPLPRAQVASPSSLFLSHSLPPPLSLLFRLCVSLVSCSPPYFPLSFGVRCTLWRWRSRRCFRLGFRTSSPISPFPTFSLSRFNAFRRIPVRGKRSSTCFHSFPLFSVRSVCARFVAVVSKERRSGPRENRLSPVSPILEVARGTIASKPVFRFPDLWALLKHLALPLESWFKKRKACAPKSSLHPYCETTEIPSTKLDARRLSEVLIILFRVDEQG